jgi:16S rRNA (uracil1498-N3)-methyltransferase
MSHPRRFYVPDMGTSPIRKRITLDSHQTHHLKNILRLKQESLVEVFDASNQCYLAKVLFSGKKKMTELVIISRKEASCFQQRADITLACAIPKGNRMDYLIEKVAELGLSKVIPLITDRTVVKINKDSKNERHKIDRWHRLAISAARQTGQSSILQIAPAIPFASLEKVIKDFSLCLIAIPEANKYLPEVLEKSNISGKILYLIGPEGDWTSDEVATALKWNFQPVRLPVNSILRVETAAVAMLAMLIYYYGSVKKT